MTIDLLCIGHTALDYLIDVEDYAEVNGSVSIKNFNNLTGGAAANVAVIGSTLGLKTGLVSAVGDEFKNSAYRKKLKKLKVDLSEIIPVEGETTPSAFMITDKEKNQMSYFYWGASKGFKNSKLPLKSIKKARVVHLATGDPDYNIRVAVEAKKQGKIISFDPGQDLHEYSYESLKKIIGLSTILFCNNYEIDRIQNCLDMSISELRELGPEIIIKTCGRKGSYFYGDEELYVEAVLRDAVDPTGAGDSYKAAFIKAYLDGEAMEDAIKFASSVSSFIVEERGCQENIPSYEEAKKRMNDFYK